MVINPQNARDFEACFDVSRETILRLVTYEALLRKWQQKINLVGPSTVDAFWTRHAADSAQIWAPLAKWVLPRKGIWLDLGAGAGFPGLVIAMLFAEHSRAQRVHLVESDQRKCAFMRTVIRETALDAQVHHCRLETLASATRKPWGSVDVVSARALAPLKRLLTYVAPFFGDATRGVFPKGRGWADELAEARAHIHCDVDILPSLTDKASRILHIRHIMAHHTAQDKMRPIK